MKVFTMKYFDYHIHNRISFDSEETLSEHCRNALARGLDEIALTNHYELDMVLQGTAEPPDLEAEERELQKAREEYAGKLTILRGIELGQPDYDLCAARRLIAQREYDVVLGSLHNGMRGIDFYYMNCDDYTDSELIQLWEGYLSLLARIARTAEIDVLTHILYPLRYIKAERKGCLPMGLSYFEPIFKGLIERGIALELNTSALRSGTLPEPDPCGRLLRFYRALGGEYLSVGSDAHRACDIGKGVKEAHELARASGFRYLTTFRKRQKILEAIS